MDLVYACILCPMAARVQKMREGAAKKMAGFDSEKMAVDVERAQAVQ